MSLSAQDLSDQHSTIPANDCHPTTAVRWLPFSKSTIPKTEDGMQRIEINRFTWSSDSSAAQLIDLCSLLCQQDKLISQNKDLRHLDDEGILFGPTNQDKCLFFTDWFFLRQFHQTMQSFWSPNDALQQQPYGNSERSLQKDFNCRVTA